MLICWLLCGILGYLLAKDKKMGSTTGAVLGFLLGIIGIIIILCSKNNENS